MLFGKRGEENVVVRGARVIDPTEGVDAILDVRVDAGMIAQLGTSLETNEHRVIDGKGLVLAPAFVDPHVEGRVDPLRRIDDPRAADHEVVLACAPGEEHHATSTAAAAWTPTGPLVSRS